MKVIPETRSLQRVNCVFDLHSPIKEIYYEIWTKKCCNKVDDFFSNVTYLNKIKYYDYSGVNLSQASRFLDNVKYTLEPVSNVTDNWETWIFEYSRVKIVRPFEFDANIYFLLLFLGKTYINDAIRKTNHKWRSESVSDFFPYWRLRTIHLERDCGPINWFNTDAFLCLSQTRTWISNAICYCIYLCSLIWYERWFSVLLILLELQTITV